MTTRLIHDPIDAAVVMQNIEIERDLADLREAQANEKANPFPHGRWAPKHRGKSTCPECRGSGRKLVRIGGKFAHVDCDCNEG